MPIPYVKKKKHSQTAEVRDASSVRKERAHIRKDKHHDNASTEKVGKRHKRRGEKQEKKEGKEKKKRSIWKKLALIALFLGIAGIGLGLIGIAAGYAWVSKDLADIADIDTRVVAESTKIYDRTGNTLLYEVGDYRRTVVPDDKIDEKIKWATVALEDRRFYEHKGIDPIGMARALLSYRTLGTAQGASTLTQQFIKKAVLSDERTWTRKFKEIILAIRLEQRYSKDQILGMYLNEVPYGGNILGVEEAAKTYFGKSASDVTLAEAATLASLPKAPSRFLNNPDRLKERRDYAIDILQEEGKITEEEATTAKAEEVHLDDSAISIKAPHFVFYVLDYLEEKYGKSYGKEGLKVITTLDWEKQEKAEKAIADGIPKVEQYGGSNAALVSLDAHNGQILAMVGSRDWRDSEHDGQVNVATRLNQPGSSFKPIVYLKAFEKGYTPDTKIYDVPTTFPGANGGQDYIPYNYDGRTHGPLQLRNTLPWSLNIPAVKILYLVGVNDALDLAESLGYTTFGDRGKFGLAIVLGGADVTLLEHTTAYAALAREGEYHKAAAVLRIEDNNGNAIEEFHDEPRQAVDKNAVRTLNSVLSDFNNRSAVFPRLKLSDRPVAVKTGTTNDFNDAWTMGYTPSYATGVWVGNNDDSDMSKGADGSVVAAPIWIAYMESILAGTPVENFQAASYKAANEALGGNLDQEEEYVVDKNTNELVPDECKATYPPEYIEKKKLKETHTILHYIDRTNPTGTAPENPKKDTMYAAWEKGVQDWAKGDEQKTQYFSEDSPKADCSLTEENQKPKTDITSVKDGETYTKKSFLVSASVTPGKKRTITSITVSIDGNVVDSHTGLSIAATQSFQSTYTPKTLTAGRHEVGIKVVDDRGHVVTDAVKFIYEE